MHGTSRIDNSRITVIVKTRREGSHGEADAASKKTTVTEVGVKPEGGRKENFLPVLEGLDD